MVFARRILFPVYIVQKAYDAPELFVLGIELPREKAHSSFDRFAVLDMKRFLVVFLQKRECLIARQPCFKTGHFPSLHRTNNSTKPLCATTFACTLLATAARSLESALRTKKRGLGWTGVHQTPLSIRKAYTIPAQKRLAPPTDRPTELATTSCRRPGQQQLRQPPCWPRARPCPSESR